MSLCPAGRGSYRDIKFVNENQLIFGLSFFSQISNKISEIVDCFSKILMKTLGVPTKKNQNFPVFVEFVGNKFRHLKIFHKIFGQKKKTLILYSKIIGKKIENEIGF